MTVSRGIYQPRGSGHAHSAGYIHRGVGGSKKLQHVEVVEKALGKPIPKGARIHHVNEIKTDNRPENLVLCPNQSYHFLLHARTAALDACGHADWRKCRFCAKYDAPTNLRTLKRSGKHKTPGWFHESCRAAYMKAWKAKRKWLSKTSPNAT